MRHYKIMLKTKGPVHIGNGETIHKKDYFVKRDGTIAVLDARTFVSKLKDEEVEKYCNFLLEKDSRSSLQDLMDESMSFNKAAHESIAYTTSAKLSYGRGGRCHYFKADACVKDAYGRPYIPGSTLKGMIRTAILTTALMLDSGRKQEFDAELRRLVMGSEYKRKSVEELSSDIEKAFLRVDKPSTYGSANEFDAMKYVSVSDSEPLDPSVLTFAQKYDLFAEGAKKESGGRDFGQSISEGNALNIYRECIKPGVDIVARIDIDERVDKLFGKPTDTEQLTRLMQVVDTLYQKMFSSKFDLSGVVSDDSEESAAEEDSDRCHYVYASGPLKGQRCRNKAIGDTGYCRTHKDKIKKKVPMTACYIGGGVGFGSKTIANAILRYDPSRVGVISHILFDQFPTKVDSRFESGRYRSLVNDIRSRGYVPRTMKAPPRGRKIQAKDDHRYWKDSDFGVSPHTFKLGIIGDKKYQMGLCDIAFVEEDD